MLYKPLKGFLVLISTLYYPKIQRVVLLNVFMLTKFVFKSPYALYQNIGAQKV